MIEAVIGFVGVIVGAAITILKDVVVSSRQRRKDGSYSAVRLISVLRQYSDHCVDVVFDDGTSHGMPAGRTDDGELFHKVQVVTPSAPKYPPDIVWRSLPDDLMHQILLFPDKALETDRRIAAVAEFTGTPPGYEEVFSARHEGYARLGHEALTMVKHLSEIYGIQLQTTGVKGSDWDALEFFNVRIAEFDDETKDQEPT